MIEVLEVIYTPYEAKQLASTFSPEHARALIAGLGVRQNILDNKLERAWCKKRDPGLLIACEALQRLANHED